MDNIIGKRIKEAVMYRGVTQSWLALKAEIDTGSITNYIKGRYKPKQDALFAMAKALRVSPQWLAGFDVPRDGLTAPSEPQLNDGEEKLLELFRSVPEQDRDLVLQMIEVALSNKR